MSLEAAIEVRIGSLSLDVALTVQPGEVLALLGPNGAGKTSVLRCLAGLAPIDAGCITIDGTVVDRPASAAHLRSGSDAGEVFVEPEQRQVGFVFQDYLLFAHMSVLENVAYGVRARGVAKAEARRIAGEWLERMGVGAYASQRPQVLSGGQAQRTALARALATAPRLLLLDEPLAALDVATRTTVRRDLRRHLGEFGGMCVLVTHDPLDAYALADRVAVVDAGRIVQTGTLADVTARPRSRYAADLVGVNLVAGVVDDGVLTTDAGARVVIADAPAGPSFAIIRPQSVALVRVPTDGSSARNVWPGTVTVIDRLGDRVRVGIDGVLPLTAEITTASLDSLGLRAGDPVHASVKATDIECYAA